MIFHLRIFSYRFAKQVLNNRLVLKEEIEKNLTVPDIDMGFLSRPYF